MARVRARILAGHRPPTAGRAATRCPAAGVGFVAKVRSGIDVAQVRGGVGGVVVVVCCGGCVWGGGGGGGGSH